MPSKHANIPGPRQQGAHLGVEQGGQRVCRRQKHSAIALAVSLFPSFQETANHDETQVVVVNRRIGQILQFLRESTSLRTTAVHPQNARKETGAPFLGRLHVVQVPMVCASTDVAGSHRIVNHRAQLGQCAFHLTMAIGQLFLYIERLCLRTSYSAKTSKHEICQET